jgi:hypothetical protein
VLSLDRHRSQISVHPFFLLESIFCFVYLVQPGVTIKVERWALLFFIGRFDNPSTHDGPG